MAKKISYFVKVLLFEGLSSRVSLSFDVFRRMVILIPLHDGGGLEIGQVSKQIIYFGYNIE